MLPANVINDRVYVLQSRWDAYVAQGSFELFIEFTVAVNSLTEHFSRLRLPGLIRLCEGLENAALSMLGTPESHPISAQAIANLKRQVSTLLGAVECSRQISSDRRHETTPANIAEIDWIRPRQVQIVSTQEKNNFANTLAHQLNFFGFQTQIATWESPIEQTSPPLAVVFIPDDGFIDLSPNDERQISAIRDAYPATQLIFIEAHSGLESIIRLMRAGIDQTIPAEDGSSRVLNCILDLVQSHEQEKYRVLVVEDSRVAVALIQRTLSEHGIDSHAIRNPSNLLEELTRYQPDLILMDMHMPRFNGIEATRALRQICANATPPIVYLSGETEIGRQVEALRLGGDQFVNKPFNPVLLSAVVKSKIERFRETQRSSKLDGLTGLLNHTAAKSRLKALLATRLPNQPLTVAMIDIDHFKSINDTYGHPVGDQVIRGLAWLLKGRLRASDLIGRYGGEEFLVALPDLHPQQALQIIDKIRYDFSQLPHAHVSGALFATFSAGVASFPDFETPQTLTEAADFALLEAKRSGRNRVERATEAIKSDECFTLLQNV